MADYFEVYADGELVLRTPVNDRPTAEEIDAAVETALGSEIPEDEVPL